MKDFLEFLGLVIAALVPIVGAIYWLISVYYNQQRTLAAEKQSRMDAALLSLKETVDDHARMLDGHNSKIQDVHKDLSHATRGMQNLQSELKEFSKSTDQYVRNVEVKMSRLEVITENLSILRKPK